MFNKPQLTPPKNKLESFYDLQDEAPRMKYILNFDDTPAFFEEL